MNSLFTNRSNRYRLPAVFFVGILNILFILQAFSQFEEDAARNAERLNYKKPSTVTFEVIAFWTEDTSAVRIAIIYKLDPSFLFFTRSDNMHQNIYEAKGELGIEILNDKEATIANDFRIIDIRKNSQFDESIESSDTIGGIFVASVGSGTHRIVLYAKDNASGKSIVDRDNKIDFKKYSASELNISSLTFCRTKVPDTSSAEAKFYLMNYGGNMIIGRPGACLFQVFSQDTVNDISISWKIKNRIGSERTDSKEYSGDKCFQAAGNPMIAENKKDIYITIVRSSKKSRIVSVPLPLERLETGQYQLKIDAAQGIMKISKSINFNVIWPHQPRSLLTTRIAIDALQHIASKKEIDQMTALNYKISMNAFREFWSKHNPDTTSAYNPVMAEYYRRVDETIKKYSTKEEIDGYRTDRGRIFILFGSPSMTNRLLKPNAAATEIWTYEKQRRRFTFTDQQRNGNYILVKAEVY